MIADINENVSGLDCGQRRSGELAASPRNWLSDRIREGGIKRVLISGWYGFGNIGDEAILHALIDRIVMTSPGTTVTALSYRPAYTRRVQAIRSAHQLPFTLVSWLSWIIKFRWIKTLAAFLRCDTFIMGGGGFLSDVQPEVPRGWLKQFRLAKLLGRRTLLCGIGAGPFNTEQGRAAVAYYLNRYVDQISVRDRESYRCLVEDCGVYAAKVSIEIDPVALMDFSRWRAPSTATDAIGIIYTKYFDRSLFGAAQSLWPLLRECFLAQIHAVRAAGYPVRLIFFQSEIESALARELSENADVSCAFPADPEEAVREMSQCRAIISFRLHGNIIAHAMRLPYLPIVYHHKGLGFLEMVGKTDPMEMIIVGDGLNLPEKVLDPEEWVRCTERFLAKLAPPDHG